MITGDFHMHTSFSTDCQSDMETMLEGAVNKGMKVVCITDHWDQDFPEKYGKPGEALFRFDLDEYFQKLEKIKAMFAGKVEVRFGVELGLQVHLETEYARLIEKYPFDFVIGSLHLVEGTDPYYGEVFQKQSDAEVYRKAFCETAENLKCIKDFDVLGHIDYIVRYGKQKEKFYTYEEVRDEIEEILKNLIATGRGLEVNTAGWKYGLKFCHPQPGIIKRYRELGGEIITIGSDAHLPEHVGYEFSRAEEVLRQCGFRYYAQFRNRKPEFIKL